MKIEIRKEKPADIDAIFSVTEKAFLNAQHTQHTEQFIVNALRNNQALSLSLVALHNNIIVGHVAFSPVSISGCHQHWLGVGPISVLPHLQNRGIGAQLMQAGLDWLANVGIDGCVLVGDPRFYSRFGFSAQHGLILPDVPAEYLLAKSISGVIPQGIVTFNEAFQAKQ